MEAYASASGTRTAHTVSPAIGSPRSHPGRYPRSEVKTGSVTVRTSRWHRGPAIVSRSVAAP